MTVFDRYIENGEVYDRSNADGFDIPVYRYISMHIPSAKVPDARQARGCTYQWSIVPCTGPVRYLTRSNFAESCGKFAVHIHSFVSAPGSLRKGCVPPQAPPRPHPPD